MADSHSTHKLYSLDSELTFPMQQNPGKSYPHFYFKSLFILFIIILLPFLTSQAPEFLNKTILTKYWELLQLLFVGILVSYGLFSSRRNVTMNIETHSNVDITQTYLSGISHVSSIFEDGFENLRGSDEKRVIQSWNYQHLHTESMGVFNNGSSVLYEQRNPGPYNADHEFDQLPKSNPKSSFGYRSLGLPIRSLKSRSVESDKPEPINVGESSSRLKGFPKHVDKVDKDKTRGFVNLEDKFKETVVPSPIPWALRSFGMEKREELASLKPTPSDSRPFSVGKFEFKPLKSQPFRSPISPHASSSSIFSSLPPVNPKLQSPPKMEDTKREEISHGSFLEAPHSSSKDSSFIFSSIPPVNPKLQSPKMEDTKREEISHGSFLEASHASSKESSSIFSSLPPVNPKLQSPKMEDTKREEISHGSFLEASSASSKDSSSIFSSLSSVNPKLQNPKMEDTKREEISHGSFLEASRATSKDSSSIFSSLPPVNPKLQSPKMEDTKREEISHGSFLEASRASYKDSSSIFSSLSSVNPKLQSPKMEDTKREEISHGSFLEASRASYKDSSSIFSSLSSVNPKLQNQKMEDKKRDKISHGSFLEASNEPFVCSNTQRFSMGSSSEVKAKRGFKDNLKDFGKNKIGDCCGRGNEVVDSLNTDAKCNKTEAFSKGKSRGKSVRTIRPSETFLEAMKTEQVCPIKIDDKVEPQFEKLESVSVEKQNLDKLPCESNPSFLKYSKGQRQVLADGTIVESERESESDFDNFEANSDEEKCDPESDSGGVDKRASEFIAMFKEQIRLQRVNAVKGL